MSLIYKKTITIPEGTQNPFLDLKEIAMKKKTKEGRDYTVITYQKEVSLSKRIGYFFKGLKTFIFSPNLALKKWHKAIASHQIKVKIPETATSNEDKVDNPAITNVNVTTPDVTSEPYAVKINPNGIYPDLSSLQKEMTSAKPKEYTTLAQLEAID